MPIAPGRIFCSYPLCSRKLFSMWSHQRLIRRIRENGTPCAVLLWIFLVCFSFKYSDPLHPRAIKTLPSFHCVYIQSCCFYTATSTQKQLKNLADHVPEFGVQKTFTLREATDQQLLCSVQQNVLTACKALCWPCGAHPHGFRYRNPRAGRASPALPSAEPKASPLLLSGGTGGRSLLDPP